MNKVWFIEILSLGILWEWLRMMEGIFYKIDIFLFIYKGNKLVGVKVMFIYLV